MSDIEYYEKGRTQIEGLEKIKKRKNKVDKEILVNGTIVYCQGNQGTGSFVGIVYDNFKVLELECGSSAYIKSNDYIHLGDTISYWTIEKVLKTKLIIEDVLKEV